MSNEGAGTGVKATALGLRFAPGLTHWVSNKIARIAAPLSRAILGREYALGETRFRAMQHNYVEHAIYPGSLVEPGRLAVQGYLVEFFTGFKAVLPTQAEANRSFVAALYDRPCDLSSREREITKYVTGQANKYKNRPFGDIFLQQINRFVKGEKIEASYSTPEIEGLGQGARESLESANLWTWFYHSVGYSVGNIASPSTSEVSAAWPKTIVPTGA